MSLCFESPVVLFSPLVANLLIVYCITNRQFHPYTLSPLQSRENQAYLAVTDATSLNDNPDLSQQTFNYM